MNAVRIAIAGLLASLAVGACGPAQPNSADGSRNSPDVGTPQLPHTLNIIMRVEPPEILEGAVDRSAVHKPLFTATLGAWDLQEAPFPILAASVPQLNTDAWTVFAGGRMETVYQLRPGLVWHDGVPLTADDFVFTRAVEVARVEWGLSRPTAEYRQMEEVEARDSSTVVIRWRRPYSQAAAPELIPYPRHILEPVLAQGQAETFGNHPYWNTEWIGAGPFRIDRWERGAFIEGVAFDRYALGRPKIDRVHVTWGDDPNANFTRLLAGDADIALDGAILFQQASILKQQWNSPTSGTVMLNPTSLRYIQVQARPAYLNPGALADVRVRKAILHLIDRPTLAQAIVEDQSMVADTIPPRTVPYYAAVERAITAYPFDARRADQLLMDAGFRKGADGFYVNGADERLSPEVRGVARGQEEQDTTIVTGSLRDAGINAAMLLLPSSRRAVDDEMKGTFPALTLNNNTLQRGLGLDKWHSSNIGSPETNWVGTNRSGWANREFDRLHELWTTTLDGGEANQHLVRMMALLSEELPSLPLYDNFQVVAHASRVRGPQPITPDSTRYGNIHEWEIR